MTGSEKTAVPIRYGNRFLGAYAGKITQDPDVALTELVANAWDAGAMNVWLTIPDDVGGRLVVEDDGSGMTREEFERRWSEFSYNRLAEQGPEVTFPPGVTARPRRAFGRNGKGRHALFCFSASYRVLTWRDGEANEFTVQKEGTDARHPMRITYIKTTNRKDSGTKLTVESQRQLLDAERMKTILGSRFIGYPEFKIHINDEFVERVDLAHLVHERRTLQLSTGEDLEVSCIDMQKPGRTMDLNGQYWWVNSRVVEEARWDGIDRKLLDGRRAQAKRYVFIIEADSLVEDVEADWTGFHKTDRVREARGLVSEHVEGVLGRLLLGSRKARTDAVVSANETEIRHLAPSGRSILLKFIDDVLRECPSISQKDLDNTAKILISLEQSRSKYALLQELSQRNPNDLDSLQQILAKWDVREAQIVLDELQDRLTLIRDLDRLIRERDTRELHDLQPLFQRGLWMFGAEYESIEFTSNRTLATVLRDLFGAGTAENPRDRPDFVVLPDRASSLSIQSRDGYKYGEPTGRLSQVLIVELKRGQATVGDKEMNQAQSYARAIRRSGQLHETTEIEAFVLGGSVDTQLEPVVKLGDHTRIIPLTFDGVLRKAQSRTFNLIEKIKRLHPDANRITPGLVLQQAID